MIRNMSYIHGSSFICIFGFVTNTMYCVTLQENGKIEYSRKYKEKAESILRNSIICDDLLSSFISGEIKEEFLPI
jgi:hypothetical protein